MNLFEVVNDIKKDNFKIQNAQIAIWKENNNWKAKEFYLPEFSNQISSSEEAAKNDFLRLEEISKIDHEALLVFGSTLVASALYDANRECEKLKTRDNLKLQEFFNAGILEYLEFNYGSDSGDEIWKYLKGKK